MYIQHVGYIQVMPLLQYRIASNFHGQKFRYLRGQADLHEHFPHENIGIVYRNACNAGNEVKRIFLLMKISAFTGKQILTPQKLPTIRYTYMYIVHTARHLYMI